MNLTLHHPEDPGCEYGRHCWSHNTDEPAWTPVWRECAECGHTYRTARELRKAYRATAMPRREFYRASFPEDGPVWRAWIGYWLRTRFIRADRITFCPFCTHDW